jgi:superfamily I DNA/RNA helicase
MHPIYSEGSSAYFKAVNAALDCCANYGHHLPRIEAVRALRSTAGFVADEPTDLDLVLEQYSAAVMAATYTALRLDHGLFVMTAHQAKGKEFDVVVLSDASARFWEDSEETRRLFYVAMTRASKSWTVIAPDSGGSPLLRTLTG